jgi:hypothetical protein
MLKKFLLTLALVAFAPSAFADVRWYDPKFDSLDTLRACFHVIAIKQSPQQGYLAKLGYTGAESGTDKLDRKVAYSTIDDIEFVQTGYPDESDPFWYAYQNNVYVCEISWEYGQHWVVSREEVTGDR